MGYNKTVLDNGVRIVTDNLPNTRSASLGIWVDAGSRDEVNLERGVSVSYTHLTLPTN